MTLLEQVQTTPTLGCALPTGMFVRYREKLGDSSSAPIVLLHGIGSGSGSWIAQLQSDSPQRLLAWDAPGYADSTALKIDQPSAADYAQVLTTWLGEMQIEQVHLVGHSLGCLMAAAFAKNNPSRVLSLSLLAPAQGYGTASPEVQNSKAQDRLQAVATLGMQKMAALRAPRLLSPQASAEQIELAQHMMSRLNERGYAQATWMLSGGTIRADLQAFQAAALHCKIRVACGEQDIITPPAACQDLATAIGAPYTTIAQAGHLCAIEAPQAVLAWITSP